MHYATLTTFRINQLPHIPKTSVPSVFSVRDNDDAIICTSLRRLHRRSRAHAMTLGGVVQQHTQICYTPHIQRTTATYCMRHAKLLLEKDTRL